MSTFVLNETAQHALRSVNDLSELKEYGLKGLNMVKVRPDNSIGLTDERYIFSLDSSKLAGNIPLNRIEMKARIRVTANGPISNAGQAYDATAPFMIEDSAGRNDGNYLMSAANGGLDSFVCNKMFSNIDLSDKQVQFVQESRDPSKVDIMSRLYQEENLKQSGIYLEDTYGGYDQKVGGQYELQSLYNPTSAQAQYARACDPDSIMDRNRFWKQNTNNQYIRVRSNTFYADTSGKGAIVPAVAIMTEPYRSLNKNVSSFYQASAPALSQVIDYDVVEDLCHDILVTKYQKEPVHAGIPATDIVFTFTKSTLINSLYKTSNTDITSIKVEIVDLELKVLTFNFGILDIPVNKPYYIPFFSEIVNQETLNLSTVDQVIDRQTQTRQYNSVPEYIAIWCQEPSSSAGILQNRSSNFTPAKVIELKLQIDNDIQTPLYNLSLDELKFRTLTNMADAGWNVDAILRKMPLNASGLQDWFGANGGVSGGAAYTAANQIVGRSAITSNRSLLDGFFLLKVDKDIRLPANLAVGLDVKINFTWTVSFDTLSNSSYMNGNTNCVFYSYAFFPSVYKVSAEKGLLKAVKTTMSPAEMKILADGTNSIIKTANLPNYHMYRSTNPILIGSGFGQIVDIAKKNFPLARKIVHGVSGLAADIADEFEGDIASAISKGARAVKAATRKSSNKKSGRKPKMLRLM